MPPACQSKLVSNLQSEDRCDLNVKFFGSLCRVDAAMEANNTSAEPAAPAASVAETGSESSEDQETQQETEQWKQRLTTLREKENFDDKVGYSRR